jgi:hypothetical protein
MLQNIRFLLQEKQFFVGFWQDIFWAFAGGGLFFAEMEGRRGEGKVAELIFFGLQSFCQFPCYKKLKYFILLQYHRYRRNCSPTAGRAQD